MQHLLIEYLEKYNFLKIVDVNSIFADMKSIIQLLRWHFLSTWNNFELERLQKQLILPSFFKVFVILSPVSLSNLGSDLSIDKTVQQGSADTKIGSQNAGKKVLELTEKWK